MKAATGELNLTVITILAIAAVSAFFWFLWPQIRDTIGESWGNVSGRRSDADIQEENRIRL